MPQIRPTASRVDREQAARALTDALAGPPPTSDLRALVQDVGGSRAAGGLVGRSPRTIQRWMAGQVDHVPRDARQAITRASQAERTRSLVDQLGGVRRVAALTGRSVRTVQRWTTGQIRAPRRDAQRALQRGNVAVRMSLLGLAIDPATGQPASPVFMRLSGNIRAKGSSTSPDYNYDRRIGVLRDPRGERIPDDVVAAIVQHLSVGDRWSALQALEAWLSTDFSAVGTYNPSDGYGMFVDRIDDVEFNQ